MSAAKAMLSQRSLILWTALALGALAIGGIVARALWPSFFVDGPGRASTDVRLSPDRIVDVGGVPITNTLLSEWLSMVLVAVLFALVRWGPRRQTRLLRSLVDGALDALLRFVQENAGGRASRWLFPIAATMMIFIAANAVTGMFPFYGVVFVELKDGSSAPLVKAAGTDVNMSLALAAVSAVVIEATGLLTVGRSYVVRFVPLGNLLRGKLAQGFLDLFVGALECVMEFFRILALMVRLFGSMTAAEMLIAAIAFLAPLVLGLPFRGLELVIAAVQAWIFGGLTVLFAANAMSARAGATSEASNA